MASSDCGNIDSKTDSQPPLSNPIQRSCKGIKVVSRVPPSRCDDPIESSELDKSISNKVVTNESLNGKPLKDLTNEECVLLLEDLGIPEAEDHCRKDFTGEDLKDFKHIEDLKFIGLINEELYPPFKLTKWLAALFLFQEQGYINVERLHLKKLRKSHVLLSSKNQQLQENLNALTSELQQVKSESDAKLKANDEVIQSLVERLEKFNEESQLRGMEIKSLIERLEKSNQSRDLEIQKQREEIQKQRETIQKQRQELQTMGLQLESVFQWKSDLRKFDNESLHAAVQLWFDSRALCEKLYGMIGEWDTSEVTNMEKLFYQKFQFNEDISKWNVSNVTNMSNMFAYVSSFNKPLSSWNVSNVTNMSMMFWRASSFNQSLSSWNVSNVTNMSSMFQHASSFNYPINAPWYK